MRRVWAGICLVVVVIAGGCGGREMTLNEYVERLNMIIDNAAQQYNTHVGSALGEVLVVDAAHLDDFTPQDLQEALGQVRQIEVEVKEATEAITPPKQLAALHNLLFDFSLSLPIEDALAARAGAAASWEELSDSPEMVAYRNQLAADKQRCADFQTELDAIADRGVFADTPWLPAEMQEVVEALVRCEGFPDHPQDVYRPLPAPNP